MIKKQFPTPFDVEQAMKFRSTSYDELKKFTQGLGLINVGNGKDHIGQFAVNLLLEHEEYIQIRRLAQGAETATNISGFTVRPIRVPITIDLLVDDLGMLRRQLIEQANDPSKRGAPTQELTEPQIAGDTLTVKFKYQRIIPGRVELMERHDTEVEFKIEPISGGQWRVVCFPQSNQDVKAVEHLFRKMGATSYEPFTISLDNFTRQQRILFFDTILALYKSHPEWRVREVVEITVRQPAPNDKQTLVLGEELDLSELQQEREGEVSGPTANDLRSITQAILQGNNLRTNSFVKDCENQGFYFPSMTLSLENTQTLEVIQVTIRFKLSPEMFEVVLTDMKQGSEMGETPAVFPVERQQAILREFWDTTHEVWRQLNDGSGPVDRTRQMALGEASLSAN